MSEQYCGCNEYGVCGNCSPEDKTECAGRKQRSEPVTEQSNGSATSAATGTNSPSSVPPSNAPEAEAAGASTADANAVVTERTPLIDLDGWRCESFEWRTGHAVARSATHSTSDFQIMRVVATAAEMGDSYPGEIPARVLEWLLKGKA